MLLEADIGQRVSLVTSTTRHTVLCNITIEWKRRCEGQAGTMLTVLPQSVLLLASVGMEQQHLLPTSTAHPPCTHGRCQPDLVH